MSLTSGVFVIIWRLVCAGMLLIVLMELHWAQRYDGDALRSLRAVLASMLVVICFPLAAAIDAHTDISPGFNLRDMLEFWVWVGYAVFATSLFRFWLTLHAWARERARREHEKDE